ncbi:TetR family transcriptional regulator [Amycolatopsis mediterranei S699]|uniref:TetR family transcriptional regulator n=2 Tax=Amycolatopsis mediterranei TaxID=33910 RepID=A0A0H3D1L4_AMYMU|nr:TetR family transcriptional regulator [Amycolatopsis mediterranei]ADJ44172.1 TetR family transcriptional regulator [Amycolatopsis mediterranei U32]AEK40907.1 TetR family transcriptional regulator [Amycolatopsis mediterranei S699]AFO75885.1 TetR family transcriptional regulator [Amycolatopsis mediterranei S699]AGT83014.1 TetR family transcriptional regulator [Amycolatopsis mediterranei RB]KDO06911.1 TetR family transcriptional regulator [Amycolatopsis mediterranei]
MAKRAPRRTDGLSKEVIVQAAAAILDDGGEAALTFRALTARLSTGYGAIYHHVANKSDLLAAATDAVIARVMGDAVVEAEPREALRTVSLGLFDAIDAHPWVGAQLSREPWRPALLEVYERIGGLLEALEVPERALFDAAGALVNYVLGVAGQNAANARLLTDGEGDRAAFLATVSAQWESLAPEKYPFVHKAAAHLREHDDREQFLAGVDLFLAGVATLR